MQDKVFALFGLAARAGKLACGSFAVEKAVKSGKAHMVIVTEDASDNTKKDFRDMCVWYHVPLAFYGTRGDLGSALGKGERVVAAILNPGLAQAAAKQAAAIRGADAVAANDGSPGEEPAAKPRAGDSPGGQIDGRQLAAGSDPALAQAVGRQMAAENADGGIDHGKRAE